MGKRIAAWSILTCCSLASGALALTADDYVIAGRQYLFERTASGLTQARDIFEASRSDIDCPDCREDRDLVFLRAVTKTALLLLENNEILSLDGLFAVADQFGVPLAAIAVHESPIDCVAQEQEPDLWPPEADPQVIRRTLCDTVLPALSDVVAELGTVADGPEPFLMYLTPHETGLAGDLEVDYGDVLTLKALLLAYRALLAGQLASDLDTEAGALVVDCSSAAFLDATDARPLGAPDHDLPEGPALSVFDGDLATVEQARHDWRQAVEGYLGAVDYVAAEDDPPGTDPQEDEFVYIAIDSDAPSCLDRFRQTLMAFGDFFLEAGSAGPTTETYDVYDTEAMRIGQLTLVINGPHLEGSSGRMVLADGSTLDVDWFGTLEEGQVGASLFAAAAGREGWFEGTIDSGRNVISSGALDLWPTVDPKGSIEGSPGHSGTPAYLDATLAWSKMAWAQLREVLTPISTGYSATP